MKYIHSNEHSLPSCLPLHGNFVSCEHTLSIRNVNSNGNGSRTQGGEENKKAVIMGSGALCLSID